ncbi:hypothetical protein [Marinactinospora rubrisoli]|uniref:Uncharacterized protein n=1 Tax=Marinactinospora rubrisoli TaxID=2715399 RepID=A0ABW2KNK9_9ACTN
MSDRTSYFYFIAFRFWNDDGEGTASFHSLVDVAPGATAERVFSWARDQVVAQHPDWTSHIVTGWTLQPNEL